MLDAGARRVLPAHLLRRCQVAKILLLLDLGTKPLKSCMAVCCCQKHSLVQQSSRSPSYMALHITALIATLLLCSWASDVSSSLPQVLSSLQLGHGTFVQRTAITARAGEEAVLIWTLTQQDGRWCVQSIKRDESCDYPLPTRPHPRCAPSSCPLVFQIKEGQIRFCHQTQ